MTARRTLLVAGATGIVGRAAIEHFVGCDGWDVIALSRRPPAVRDLRHVAADLTDPADVDRALASCGDVTHLLYTALFEKPDLVAGWRDADQMRVNAAMFANLLDALARHAPRLVHLTLMQGAKAYGLHDTQVPVPAKERWPRAPHAVFYWPQEDLLRQRRRGASWTFSILRPQLVLGAAMGSPMNVIGAIGAYAAIQRELGEPLRFPGGGRYVHAASDSRLIARAVEFCGTHASAADATFNVVNGDTMVWHDLWSAVAAHFGMALGEPLPMRLAEAMPKHEATWARIVAKHGLRETTLQALLGASWQFTDRTFGYGLAAPLDRLESPIALWQAGFTGCEDTEDAIVHWLGRMQDERLLPR